MRKLPPLTAIRAFEAAARLQSFTRAADELCVTVTAISHQIRHLEDCLDIRLFERTARAVVLTEAGERIFPLLCEGFDKLGAAFSLLNDGDEETIILSTTRAFAERWLIPRLVSFHQAFPGVSLHIEASDDVLDQRVANVDLSIRYGNPPDCLSNRSVLLKDRYIALASAKIADNSGVALHALRDRPLLSYKWKNPALGGPSWHDWLDTAGERHGEPYHFFQFNDETLALHAAEFGVGPVLCSDVIMANQVAADEFRPIDGNALRGLSYYLVERPVTRRRKCIAGCIEWLQDEAASFARQLASISLPALAA